MAVIWLYGGNFLRERFRQTGNSSTAINQGTEASTSAEQRKELFYQSLRVTAQHPLFGVGPGNFRIVSGVWRVAHNSYMQVSAEGGIPAFLLYLLIFYRGLANLRNLRRFSKPDSEIDFFSMGLEASLAAYLVGSMFTSDSYQLFPYCLVAYTSALLLIARRDRAISIRIRKSLSTTFQEEITLWQ